EALSAQSEPALATLQAVRADFPGAAAPAILVVTGPAKAQSAGQRELRRLEAMAVARGIVHPPFTLNGNLEGTAAVGELPLARAGKTAASGQGVEVLRGELIPPTLGRVPGVRTAVTGDTAEDVDFTRQMKHGVPYVIAFVLVLAFLLLLVAF